MVGLIILFATGLRGSLAMGAGVAIVAGVSGNIDFRPSAHEEERITAEVIINEEIVFLIMLKC